MYMDYCDNGVVSNGVPATSMNVDHPNRVANLEVKVAIANLHNSTHSSISETIQLVSQFNPALIPRDVCDIIIQNADRLNNEIIHKRDFVYWDYFGLQVLIKSCLLKAGDKIMERPQHMLMRKAVSIHKHDIESAIRTYHLMSQGFFINVKYRDDGETMFNTIKPTGGIGLSFQPRLYGSDVVTSTGIIPPVLNLFNSKEHSEGMQALYLEPWHIDIFSFIDLVYEHRPGPGDNRFFALWVPDLFMERVESKSEWSLFHPDDVPGLADCCGEEFERLYTKYERECRKGEIVSAVDLWCKILYELVPNNAFCILFKDNCYKKNKNRVFQEPYTDIVEYTGPTEIITSNLASISLPKFVMEKGIPSELQPSKLVGSCGSKNRYFDFVKLAEITSIVTNNLDKIIDDATETSFSKHRPIGIGVHGLADTFILLGIPFDSAEAHQLNKDIFETIYYHALKTSSELAKRDGHYQVYSGSAISKGILEPDMWGVVPSHRWNWDSLRQMIAQNGVRNTVVLSVVLNTSTSQILGCNVSTEPYCCNVNVQSGKFIVNNHLLHDLTEMGLWSSTSMNDILENECSVEGIPEIPLELKAIYRIAEEVRPKTLVDMALDRGCFLGESQIINIIPNCYVNHLRLEKLHFYIWEKQDINRYIKSRHKQNMNRISNLQS